MSVSFWNFASRRHLQSFLAGPMYGEKRSPVFFVAEKVNPRVNYRVRHGQYQGDTQYSRPPRLTWKELKIKNSSVGSQQTVRAVAVIAHMRSSNISCACACCVLPIKDGDDLIRYQVWINEAQVITDGRKKVPTTLHSTNTSCPGIETNTHLLSSNLTWKNLYICRAAVKTKMKATYINIFFVEKNALYLNGLITENHRSNANRVTVKMEALPRRNTKKRFATT